MILVYQAYGRIDVIEQTFFSIASLLAVTEKSSPLKIWVYTDHVELFKKYFSGFLTQDGGRVRLVPVLPEQIKLWRGAIDFVHRVKVEVLIDASTQFKGSLFYVDGDTYFRKDPTALFSKVSDQVSLMHMAENQLNLGRDPLSKKLTKFVVKNKFKIAERQIQLSPDLVMWNAGAIGLSETHKALLPKVLQLTDAMHSIYPKHVMEQLAFSFFLQESTSVVSAEAEIGHYWDQKQAYQLAIRSFLQRYPMCDQAVIHYAQFVHPTDEGPVQKSRFSFFKKISHWLDKFARH